GATGPQGLPGNDGASGAVGATGPQGLPGNDGASGAVGATGPQGLPGNDGAAGAVGATGPQGLPGNDGAAGAVGATGPQGSQGVKGDTGDKGDMGLQGVAGPGATSWSDGFQTVTTAHSIKIGSDWPQKDCDFETWGTIRYSTQRGFEGCDGNDGKWHSLQYNPPTAYAIGDDGPAGGRVFYVTDGGRHGLEVSPADQSGSAPWGCRGISIPGADGTAVGTGAQNTVAILAGYAGCAHSGTAAAIADAYVLNGYYHWFLPSKDELNELYKQKDVVGGFADELYWSSSNYSSDAANFAWIQLFRGTGPQVGSAKDLTNRRVRAIRAF
ncbi:MAG: hypothetical protein GY934_07055, partial [Gammaproteobacteria bacterium]|nr:hypothetical protein [Gammaproteobacteria bacterium]